MDGALTAQPRTPAVWHAAHLSMQSPPASAEAICVASCPPVGPPWRAAEVKVMVDEFPQAHARRGWRQEQAGIGHQAVIERRCGYGRDCSVAASIGCSFFPGGFLFHFPDSKEHALGCFKGCPQGRPSVDSGLGLVCRSCCRSSITREPTAVERGKRGGGKHIPIERKADRELRELARQFAIM